MLEHQSRKLQKRIRISIPQDYHQDPILSNLVSAHGVQLNISAALLDAKGTGGGWFDLQLAGTQEQVNNALVYLAELNITLWYEDLEEENY